MNRYIKSVIDNETILKCINHNIAASDAADIQVHLNKLECSGKVMKSQFDWNSNCESHVLNKLNAHRLN